MRKVLITPLFLGALILPTAALALALPGTPSPITTMQTLYDKIGTAIWYIFAVAALAMFVVAGISFLTAQGDPGKLETAKKAFIWGVVGIVAAVLAFSIVNIVKDLLT